MRYNVYARSSIAAFTHRTIAAHSSYAFAAAFSMPAAYPHYYLATRQRIRQALAQRGVWTTYNLPAARTANNRDTSFGRLDTSPPTHLCNTHISRLPAALCICLCKEHVYAILTVITACRHATIPLPLSDLMDLLAPRDLTARAIRTCYTARHSVAFADRASLFPFHTCSACHRDGVDMVRAAAITHS